MEGRWVLFFIGFYILLGSFIGTHSAHDYDHAANLRFFSECESKKPEKRLGNLFCTLDSVLGYEFLNGLLEMLDGFVERAVIPAAGSV